MAACEITGADAVQPGYGFLSENALFADILEGHDITFIGPTADHIRTMGDKITAKQTMIDAGVPVVPGSEGGISTISEGKKVAKKIGYPVLVKAASGGGGGVSSFSRGESICIRPSRNSGSLQNIENT